MEWHHCGNCNNLCLKFSSFSCLSLYLFLHALLLLHLWWQDFRKQVNCEVDQRFHVSRGRQRKWGQVALWFSLLDKFHCIFYHKHSSIGPTEKVLFKYAASHIIDGISTLCSGINKINPYCPTLQYKRFNVNVLTALIFFSYIVNTHSILSIKLYRRWIPNHGRFVMSPADCVALNQKTIYLYRFDPV